jgi:hypothetical protein
MYDQMTVKTAVLYDVVKLNSNTFQERWDDGRRKTWRITTENGSLRRIECEESGEIHWYSYETKVAEAFRDGEWLRVTNRKYSSSTSRQLRKLVWIYSHRNQLDNALGWALDTLPYQVIYEVCRRSAAQVERNRR